MTPNENINYHGKILIVDDEKFNCDILYGFLMILGLKNRRKITDFAFNGEEALNLIKNAIKSGDPGRYSLILMDCNMPFMDGYEASIQIRKAYFDANITEEKQPKIIAVTGHVE